MKKVTLKLPAPLKRVIQDSQIEFDGESLNDLVQFLDEKYGTVKERLFDEEGNIRPYINIFIANKNIKDGNGMDSSINNNDQVAILTSFAGG